MDKDKPACSTLSKHNSSTSTQGKQQHRHITYITFILCSPYQYSLSMQWQNNSPPFWTVAKRHIQDGTEKKQLNSAAK